MNLNVTTTPKEAYVHICKYLHNKVGNDLLKHGFSFISSTEFLNKMQTKKQGKKVTYTQFEIGNVFFKTHYSNQDIVNHIVELINKYPLYNIIIIKSNGSINLSITENTESEYDTCIKVYEEYLNSGFADKVDFKIYLDMKNKFMRKLIC
jgi:hypothetical protein